MHEDLGGPVATLGELHQAPGWLWLHCEDCGHMRAVPLAPFVIRWGDSASGDVLRKSARCSECGHKGAALQHPSYKDTQSGRQPIPTHWPSLKVGSKVDCRVTRAMH